MPEVDLDYQFGDSLPLEIEGEFSHDPDALRSGILGTIQEVVEERRVLEQRELQAVYAARQMRVTWDEIADALGVSQPAAHARFSKRVAALEAASTTILWQELGCTVERPDSGDDEVVEAPQSSFAAVEALSQQIADLIPVERVKLGVLKTARAEATELFTRLHALSDETNVTMDRDIETLVHRCRILGLSWNAIGKVAGISAQGAQKRWGKQPTPDSETTATDASDQQ